MKRAEEAALKAYPPHDGASEQWKKAHLSSLSEYIQGYEQAEKDCALTWKDVQAIFRIADNYDSELNRPSYLTKEYCEEVLHRFNQIKEEKK